jgi:hypothetical protein
VFVQIKFRLFLVYTEHYVVGIHQQLLGVGDRPQRVLADFMLHHLENHFFSSVHDVPETHVDFYFLQEGLFIKDVLNGDHVAEKIAVFSHDGDVFDVRHNLAKVELFRTASADVNFFHDGLDDDIDDVLVVMVEIFFLVVELVENNLEI